MMESDRSDNYITYVTYNRLFSILFFGIMPSIKKLRARNFAELFSNTYLTMRVKIKKIGQL